MNPDEISVEELIRAQARAIEVYRVSIDAISTIGTTAAWVLTAIGVTAAVIALWGWATIVGNARRKAEEVAKESFSDYLKLPEFDRLVEQKVAAELKLIKRARKVEENPDHDDDDPFPEAQLQEEAAP